MVDVRPHSLEEALLLRTIKKPYGNALVPTQPGCRHAVKSVDDTHRLAVNENGSEGARDSGQRLHVPAVYSRKPR
jgi:hypothetical protein